MRVVCVERNDDEAGIQVRAEKQISNEAPDATLVLADFEPSRSEEIEIFERFEGRAQWATDFMEATLASQDRIDEAVFVETFEHDGFVVYEVSRENSEMTINDIHWHDTPLQDVDEELTSTGECMYYENAATTLWRNAVSNRRPTRTPAELGSHVRPVADVTERDWSTLYYTIAGVATVGAALAGYRFWSR